MSKTTMTAIALGLYLGPLATWAESGKVKGLNLKPDEEAQVAAVRQAMKPRCDRVFRNAVSKRRAVHLINQLARQKGDNELTALQEAVVLEAIGKRAALVKECVSQAVGSVLGCGFGTVRIGNETAADCAARLSPQVTDGIAFYMCMKNSAFEGITKLCGAMYMQLAPDLSRTMLSAVRARER